MPSTERQERAPALFRSGTAPASRPDRLILVYDGDSGLGAMLLDILKKSVGREDCALCEITYSPIGKRGAWRACEARLGVVVDDLHRVGRAELLDVAHEHHLPVERIEEPERLREQVGATLGGEGVGRVRHIAGHFVLDSAERDGSLRWRSIKRKQNATDDREHPAHDQ